MAKRGTEPAWRKVFLTSLAATGNVTKSASVARVTRPGVYKARKENAAFAEAWDIAEEDAIQQLELEARRRAYEGVDKPVFHAGEKCGVIRQYSDVLMMFLLKAHRPDTYRDRVALDHGGSVDTSGTQRIELVVVKTNKTLAQIKANDNADVDDDSSSSDRARLG